MSLDGLMRPEFLNSILMEVGISLKAKIFFGSCSIVWNAGYLFIAYQSQEAVVHAGISGKRAKHSIKAD